MSTIKNIQDEIEHALDELRQSRSVPQNFWGLRRLAPADSQPRVSFRYLGNDRKVREDASERYFDPAQCEIVIRFEMPEESEPAPAADSGHGSDRNPEGPLQVETAANRLKDLINALSQVEAERDFVALTWFRDSVLPSQCRWAADPRQAGRAVRDAIHSSLLLTAQTPNPRNPLHPVTTVRLNRSHPEIRRETPQREHGFRPLNIEGSSLSSTILEQRR